MPFIHTRTNREISKETEKALARELGNAVALLGKSENWLMLQFEDQCRLYFKGDCNLPLAFVNIKLYGKASADAYERMTAEVTRILQDHLSVPPQGVYVDYEETDRWGWNGSNF